jgi:tRNA (cytidine32/uridine32-2'-O)-methyltransferase
VVKLIKPNVRIVLVSTSHPGNIGAVARAMKNMGLSRLFLVNPKHFPSDEACARASGADDVLENARVTQSLDEAVSDCALVIGTSARIRAMPQPMLNVREAAKKITVEAESGIQTALVFGSERVGLDNEELLRCNYHVCVPTVEDFSSLNLAAAVQIFTYELRLAAISGCFSETDKHVSKETVTAKELEGLYRHIEETIIAVQFLDPKNPRKIMTRLRRIISRARIDKNDLDLLRGMLKAIQHKVKRD